MPRVLQIHPFFTEPWEENVDQVSEGQPMWTIWTVQIHGKNLGLINKLAEPQNRGHYLKAQCRFDPTPGPENRYIMYGNTSDLPPPPPPKPSSHPRVTWFGPPKWAMTKNLVWLFDIPVIFWDMSKFLPFGRVFLGEKAQILHTKGRSRYTYLCDEYFDIICSPQAKKNDPN